MESVCRGNSTVGSNPTLSASLTPTPSADRASCGDRGAAALYVEGMPLAQLDIAAEFAREAKNPNPCVGSMLLSEDNRTRVWMIVMKPGERVGLHRHVLDYFWTALTAGRARSHVNGGPAKTADYTAGQTQHMTFAKGEFMLHDLENIGTQTLVFITVEHLESANDPLPLPSSVTPRGLDAGALLP